MAAIGPRSSSHNLELSDLVVELKNVDWHELGIQLKVPFKELREIDRQCTDITRKRSEMLAFWLDNEEEPSWEKVYDALERIDHKKLMRDLKRRTSIPSTKDSKSEGETCNACEKLEEELEQTRSELQKIIEEKDRDLKDRDQILKELENAYEKNQQLEEDLKMKHHELQGVIKENLQKDNKIKEIEDGYERLLRQLQEQAVIQQHEPKLADLNKGSIPEQHSRASKKHALEYSGSSIDLCGKRHKST